MKRAEKVYRAAGDLLTSGYQAAKRGLKRGLYAAIISASLAATAYGSNIDKIEEMLAGQEQLIQIEQQLDQLLDRSCVDKCEFPKEKGIKGLVKELDYLNCLDSCLDSEYVKAEKVIDFKKAQKPQEPQAQIPEKEKPAPEYKQPVQKGQTEEKPATDYKPAKQPEQKPKISEQNLNGTSEISDTDDQKSIAEERQSQQPDYKPAKQPEQKPKISKPSPEYRSGESPQSKKTFTRFGYTVELDNSEWGILYKPDISCSDGSYQFVQNGTDIDQYAIFDEKGNRIAKKGKGQPFSFNFKDGTYWVFGMRNSEVVASYKFTKTGKKIEIDANWAEKGQKRQKGIYPLDIRCGEKTKLTASQGAKSELKSQKEAGCDINGIKLEVKQAGRGAECIVSDRAGCKETEEGIADLKGNNYYFEWFRNGKNIPSFYKEKKARLVGDIYCSIAGINSNTISIPNSPPNITGIDIRQKGERVARPDKSSVKVSPGDIKINDVYVDDPNYDEIETLELTFDGKKVSKEFIISRPGTLVAKACDEFGACSERSVDIKVKGQYGAAIGDVGRKVSKTIRDRPLYTGLAALGALSLAGIFVYRGLTRKRKKAIENLKKLAGYYKVDLAMLGKKDKQFEKYWAELKEDKLTSKKIKEFNEYLKKEMKTAEDEIKNKDREVLISNLQKGLSKYSSEHINKLDLTENTKNLFGDDWLTYLTFHRLSSWEKAKKEGKQGIQIPEIILTADIRNSLKGEKDNKAKKQELSKYYSTDNIEIRTVMSELSEFLTA